jgi:aminopeptidase N
MEYPMICFNGPRPEKDGTYSKRTKYGLISVVIHEVGHNYFPMIVNSDERQWTWMDEGLNTFLQYLAEQEWEENYPSGRGEPQKIVDYMRSTSQVPIMTNSESILQFGNNAYAKPATALNILRETVLGREQFDFAFKQYAIRWQFKRPTPADFFRTMEDASGTDLDWFWRGWFYSTDHTDIGLEALNLYTLESPDPDNTKPLKQKERDEVPETLAQQRNKELKTRVAVIPDLKDFYNAFDELNVTEADRKAYKRFLDSLDDDEKKLLEEKRNFYVIDLKNHGGLVMPVILKFEFDDGTTDELRIPAEIWRRDHTEVSKLYITAKTIKQIVLDPHLETADVELENNFLPRRVIKSRFQLFKEKQGKNEMQKAGAK